jgi:hypothetical protein
MLVHTWSWLLQVHVKLLHGLTMLHIHGVSPPVTADNLNSLFSALPALQVPCIAIALQRELRVV